MGFNRRHVPAAAAPIAGLRGCDARLNSFKAAAEELGVTPSAVSHRLKALEAELGVALFERLNREVRLTETGKGLALSLHKAFGDAVETPRCRGQPRQRGRTPEG